MSRLFVRVYLSFVGIVVVFFAVSASLFWLHGNPRERGMLAGGAVVMQHALASAEAPAAAQAARLDELSRALGMSLALFDPSAERLAEAGTLLPRPEADRPASYSERRRGETTIHLRLPDGRWLSAGVSGARPHGPGAVPGWLFSLALLALVIAAFAWPVARGIARRIERLTDRVEAFGRGDLKARASVAGRDEVATLSARFNATADRIEALVDGQRTLLASASHELRSPLARMRVAAEILGGTDVLPAERREELRLGLAGDVDRLDASVEELLAASRVDLLDGTTDAPVDLLALAAEEAAAFGVEVAGAPASVLGDARSLRHLVRNLLVNAERHGGGAPEVQVTPGEGGGARLEVADRGPGPPAEPDRAEALFAPFVSGGGGTGLGLAIARRIARHHGGSLTWDARDGGGSVFVAELPGRSTEAAPLHERQERP
jgi:signal transduction histidine kinase